MEMVPNPINLDTIQKVEKDGNKSKIIFENGKFEKEIISEIEKFAEGKDIELVVKLSIVSSLHKGRRLKTGKKKCIWCEKFQGRQK